MDEFDIFMDAVSRKMALKMLTKTAESMPHRQFIFITPQDLSMITPTEHVKIHKLNPPDRDQSTLTVGQGTNNASN